MRLAMKCKIIRSTITLKNGNQLDYITAVGIYEKLVGLSRELHQESYFHRPELSVPSSNNGTPKIAKLIQSQQTRKNRIAYFFELLNQCQAKREVTIELGQLLYALKVVPCTHQVSTRHYVILMEMMLSGMIYKDFKLHSPFARDVINIEGKEIAEIILAMYKVGLPLLSLNSPRMSEVTLWRARECVQHHSVTQYGRYFGSINLGAGPVALNVRVSQNDRVIDVTEFNGGIAYGQIAFAHVLKKQQLFCQFTGYSKGQLKILGISHDADNGTHRFELRMTRFLYIRRHDNIQLDGVLACVTHIDKYTLTACTTDELIEMTSLSTVKVGDSVNVGLSAMNDLLENSHYLLEASVMGSVELVSSHLQEGHEHTWQLNFKALNLDSEIANDQHLGLAGVSLTAKNVTHLANLTTFSIFCGKQTREQTQFNETMTVGTRVNFTPRV